MHRFQRKALLIKEFWRGGRVVDCGGLENRCTARYPGFESLSLRFKKIRSPCKLILYRDFLCLSHNCFLFLCLIVRKVPAGWIYMIMVCVFICSSGLQLSLLLKKGEGGRRAYRLLQYRNGKTICESFPNRFVSFLILLTQNELRF